MPSKQRELIDAEGQRAGSRLYRRQILQVNMRLKALAEIYTMHFFARSFVEFSFNLRKCFCCILLNLFHPGWSEK